MKQKTKISLIITIIFGIFVAFFETKTEWLVSHTRDLERTIQVMNNENKYLQKQLNYIWYEFDLPDNWDNQ